jgi:hypothetical protein
LPTKPESGNRPREGKQISKHNTSKETLDTTIEENITLPRQQEILGLSGTIDYDPRYDYKRERRRPRR